MANPTGVTAGDQATETWADAVVSRVVGIYASTAAAETDGRTEKGALITLSTDGSVWVKRSTIAGDWARVDTHSVFADISDHTTGATSLTTIHTETITGYSGVECTVQASAMLVFDVNTAADCELMIKISQNGGLSYSLGDIMDNEGLAANNRVSCAAQHGRQNITPTGDILVEVQVRSTQSDTDFIRGSLRVDVAPNI